MTAFALGQEPQLVPPQVPEDAMETRQLIAWSSLQKPQPAPQPLPDQDGQVPQPGQNPDQQAKPPADPHTEQAPAQSFTGKIVKEEGKFVLKAGSTAAYQLEAQDDLAQYENQNVRIVGSLNAERTTIRVVKIELLS
jgi:hypothetical protein